MERRQMITRAIEIRDRMTMIAAIAIQMVPYSDGNQTAEAQRWLLRKCGYDFNQPAVVLLRMDGRTGPHDIAPSDPYDWGRDGTRTMQVAHLYVTEHFDELADGAVVDVEFILGESKEPKTSERLIRS